MKTRTSRWLLFGLGVTFSESCPNPVINNPWARRKSLGSDRYLLHSYVMG